LEFSVQVTLVVDKCIGSGSCEMLAPEVFEVGDDGLAKLLDASPGSEMESKVRAAEESCPTQAISVEY
jgi:ferredoxin